MNIQSQRNCLNLPVETNFKHLNSHQEVLLSQAGTDESLEISPSGCPLGCLDLSLFPHLIFCSWQEARALQTSAYS